MEFKAEQLSEEKDLRSEEKLLNKRIAIDRNKLERDLNENMGTREVKTSQTDPIINFEKLSQTEVNRNIAAIIENSDENLSHLPLLPTRHVNIVFF